MSVWEDKYFKFWQESVQLCQEAFFEINVNAVKIQNRCDFRGQMQPYPTP